ncbi:UPF0183 protein [Glycine max]|nr:UPF0183 protein [Glycine max]
MLQRPRRRCEGTAMGAIVLDLRPGLGIGPFSLGMPICEAFAQIEQQPNLYDVVHVKYFDEEPLKLDIVISFPDHGFHLRFDPWSQRLRLIEIFDVKRLQMRYSTSLIGGPSTLATFVAVYALFGPTYPGIFDKDRGIYTLFYPGLSFAFPIPSQFTDCCHDGGVELPLEFPDGTTPVTCRVSIYDSSSGKKVGVGALMDKASAPPLPAGSIYMEEVHVKLGEELYFTVGSQHIPFGASPQDVWTELGRPCGIHQKQVDQMVIHSASDFRPRTTLCGDYFYNYFTRGLDILFDGQTHKIKKFVLHTNFPGHADFNSYIKCNFVIHGSDLGGSFQEVNNSKQRVITPSTKWEQVKEILGDCGRAAIQTQGSASNPFGSTLVYGYQNIAFEGEKQGIFQQKIWEGWCGQSQGSANDMWNKTSQEIIKVAKETLGESRGFGPRGKESWWWNESVQSKDKYKIARNETKKAVSEARAQAFDGLYQALGTRDGERSIYRLAKGRERKTRDLDHVKCVKDEEGKVLVHEKDIKESLDTREEDRNYKYYRRIQKQEVKEALKRMSNGKAVGPDNIPIEVWKTLGDRGLEWLTKLFNEIMRSKCMPEEWRRSTLVPIYKNKGDIQNCANYRGIKLMSYTMKLWERVIERRLRKETQVTENQFGFMPGRSTMEAIYLLRRVMEQYRMDQQDLHLIFIDLEKAYDRVPRKILWKALEKKGVRVAYIRAIQDMYDRISTSVRTQGGESDDFPITIGLHQGSTLSPYLFTLILDVLTEQIQEIAPRCMLFADDIVLLGESREELNERLETWRRALETHGFRLSRSKSEYMECKFNKSRRVSNSEVKIGDHIIPQVTRFKYLGSVIQDDGEIEGDVNHRIQAR